MDAWLELTLPPGWTDRVRLHDLEATTDAEGRPWIALPPSGSFVGRGKPRADEPVLQVAVDTLSRRHFRLALEPAGWTLEDLESAGGTFVNDGRVLANRPRLLEDGDVIHLGAPVGSPKAVFRLRGPS